MFYIIVIYLFIYFILVGALSALIRPLSIGRTTARAPMYTRTHAHPCFTDRRHGEIEEIGKTQLRNRNTRLDLRYVEFESEMQQRTYRRIIL